MKVIKFLFRAGIILLIGFGISYSSAVTFFNYSRYETNLDRAFLVLVPALAIAYLLNEFSPAFLKWLEQRQFYTLITFGIMAIVGALAFVPALEKTPAYFGGILTIAAIIFILMLPALVFVERSRLDHSFGHFLFGFLSSLLFTYAAIGFLSEVIKTILNMAVFAAVLIFVGSICGYYFARRAARSIHTGFLSNPLNVILCLALPLLLTSLIYASAQFPSMFVLDYIRVPSRWFGLFVADALVAGVWSFGALEQFETRGYYQWLRQTKIFEFIRDNLPGVYASGMFFLINLIITRALNHAALNINTVLFESDAGPWMSILGSPAGDAVNRSVHPLILITVRPLIRFVALFTADQWNLAAMIVVAAMSGLCVFMAWIFVKRAAGQSTYALIFAILLGSTATHLFFGSLTDTYVFGMTTLIFFLLLIQAKEDRFSILIPAGLLVFGITVTNIVQSVIGLFFNNFGFRRLVRFCVYILTAGIVLTAFASMVYPARQTFFFVPADIAFEKTFIKPVYEAPAERLLERFKIVSRTMLLYGVVGPRPIEVIAHKDPRPTIDLKTFDPPNKSYASYKSFANFPLVLWLVLLAGASVFFVKEFRSSRHLPLMLGLLGSLVFNFLLHMNYGTELFLYTPFWTYLLIFFVALAFANHSRRIWFQAVLMVFMLTLMANNFWFIFVILRGLAPFYAAT